MYQFCDRGNHSPLLLLIDLRINRNMGVLNVRNKIPKGTVSIDTYIELLYVFPFNCAAEE